MGHGLESEHPLERSPGALSPSRKMGVYAREGVKHLWLVDPGAQLLEVYRLEGGQWLLLDTHVGHAAVRAPPFEVLELPLGTVWAR